jgi:large subunit ribosomal protein L3
MGERVALHKTPEASGNFFIRNMSFILGKKSSMTQLWKDGKVVPVTAVSATPNKVTLVRNKERDGYEAVQVALGRNRCEFRHMTAHPVEISKFNLGDEVTVADFKEGEKVRVSGLNKGRGFQGVVKRHGFAGVGGATHGQKNRQRHPGSIGSTAFQRVVKGRRMAGHMGMERVTVKNLVVAGVDAEKNIIYLRGALPGMKGTIIEIRN